VKTFTSGKAGGDSGLERPDSREWVFGLLGTPRYRERVEQLESLDLRRRTGCEPCLRALVLDKWTPETLHHVGWCDSCRAATIALGMHAPAAAGSSWVRRRAAWLAVAAFAVVAVPLVGSQLIGDGGSHGVRGGSATALHASTTPGTSTGGTTTRGTTTTTTGGTTGGSTGGTGGTVKPVPRSKGSAAATHARGKKALPHTT
jgi:hypothetical protein